MKRLENTLREVVDLVKMHKHSSAALAAASASVSQSAGADGRRGRKLPGADKESPYAAGYVILLRVVLFFAFYVMLCAVFLVLSNIVSELGCVFLH